MNKFIAVLLFLMMSFASHATYMYWTVTTSDQQASGFDAVSATLMAVKTEDIGKASAEYIELKYGVIAEMPQSGGVKIDLDALGDATIYSFYVELLNYDSTTEKLYGAAISDRYSSYQTMVDSGYIDTGLSPTTPVQVWHGGTFIIPEPTTGLLVTVGMGLLALRRRRKIGIAG